MLVRWYPISGSRRRGLYNPFSIQWPTLQSLHGISHFHPRADLVESGEEYRIMIDLPGVGRDDVNISIRDGLLSVAGEKKPEENGVEEGGFRRFERLSGKFQRLFRLPEDVDRKGIEADYDNGVLTVRLPRSKKAEPREIQVKSGK